MAQSRTLRKIGAKLREESRGIVEAKLPERLRVLVDQIACMEERREPEDSHVARRVATILADRVKQVPGRPTH